MNRRSFIGVLGAGAAGLALSARASFVPAAAVKFSDPWTLLTRADIERHFVWMPTPVMKVEGQIVVARSTFTRMVVYDQDYFKPDGSVNEALREELKSPVIGYIQRWFEVCSSYGPALARRRPYVYGAFVTQGCLIGELGRFRYIMLRAAYH
jgi:hypothetical protein